MHTAVQTYLTDRGYNRDLFEQDKPFSFEGQHRTAWGSKLEHPISMAWEVRAMSGHLIGVQVRELEQKKYRWAQAPNVEHLPIIYGSERDYELLWETGKAVFAEGIMDRVALKRTWPYEIAVFARLTKGIGKQLINFVERLVEEPILAFDNDEPGDKATEKTELRIPRAVSIKLPTKDPSELLRLYGLSRARSLLKQRVGMMDL